MAVVQEQTTKDLMGSVAQPRQQKVAAVVRGAYLLARYHSFFKIPAAGFANGDQPAGFAGSHAADRLQQRRAGVENAADAAESNQQQSGQIDCGLPLCAVSEHDRQKLGIGQGPGSGAGKPLSRPLTVWPVLDGAQIHATNCAQSGRQ